VDSREIGAFVGNLCTINSGGQLMGEMISSIRADAFSCDPGMAMGKDIERDAGLGMPQPSGCDMNVYTVVEHLCGR